MRNNIKYSVALAWALTVLSSALLLGCDQRSSESTGATAGGKEVAAPAKPTAFKSVDITGADYAKQVDGALSDLLSTSV